MKKLLLAIPVIVFLTFFSGVEIIDAGHRGVKKTFGKTNEEVLSEGIHFYNPFTSQIIEMDTRLQRKDGSTITYTQDVQQADINFSVSYSLSPDHVVQILNNVDRRWENILLDDLVRDSIKNVIGKWDAVELVANRDKVSPEIKAMLQSRVNDKTAEKGLNGQVVHISSFALNDVEYTAEFENAVEAKVTAIQRAEQEKNKTVQIQEQADQKIISAKAEAESMRIRANALTQNQALVQWEAVQKWNGVLPQYMLGGNTTPFINIK